MVSDHRYFLDEAMGALVVDGRHSVLSSAEVPPGLQSSPAQLLQQIYTHVVAQIETEHDQGHSVTWDEQCSVGTQVRASEVHSNV